jgi:hypothetical protein
MLMKKMVRSPTPSCISLIDGFLEEDEVNLILKSGGCECLRRLDRTLGTHSENDKNSSGKTI